MIQNLIFGIPFFKILFRPYNVFKWTSSTFFNFRFSTRKSQSQQESSKKDHKFYNSFAQKTDSFYEPQLTRCWKWHAPATQPKNFLTLQIFQQTCFCLVSEKIFALHHFLAPRNCILEALWKQRSVYSYISP